MQAADSFPLYLLITVFVAYTVLFFLISNRTARGGDNKAYFIGNKRSPWFIVAFGMVGSSVTGVTFISVPGNVLNQSFYYLPMVLGFSVGYMIVARLLLPLYYRMNLTSIYTYLESRFGLFTYKTGSIVFMISRILGVSVRIFAVVLVLHTFIPQGVAPFWLVALIFIFVIFLYTYRGGIRTIVWTDMLQTTFMVLALLLTIYALAREMDWSFYEMFKNVKDSSYSSWFNSDLDSNTNAFKQFIAGIVVTIAMTGLDQEMMQKNLSCRTLKDSQKNIYTTSITILIVNLFFLLLGAVMAIFIEKELGGMSAIGLADSSGLFTKAETDKVFPLIASHYLGIGIGLVFIVGLISASFPSAGGAMTSLTTSFCIDFLGFDSNSSLGVRRKEVIRHRVHAIYAALLFTAVLLLYFINSKTVIDLIYILASYTYGPLLGFFFFGIFTKYSVKDRFAPYIAIASPLLCYLLERFSALYFGFEFGFSLLIINGVLSFVGMFLIRERRCQY